MKHNKATTAAFMRSHQLRGGAPSPLSGPERAMRRHMNSLMAKYDNLEDMPFAERADFLKCREALAGGVA